MFNTYELQNFHKYNSGSLGHKKVFSSLAKCAALKINLSVIKSIIQDKKMKISVKLKHNIYFQFPNGIFNFGSLYYMEVFSSPVKRN